MAVTTQRTTGDGNGRVFAHASQAHTQPLFVRGASQEPQALAKASLTFKDSRGDSTCNTHVFKRAFSNLFDDSDDDELSLPDSALSDTSVCLCSPFTDGKT